MIAGRCIQRPSYMVVLLLSALGVAVVAEYEDAGSGGGDGEVARGAHAGYP